VRRLPGFLGVEPLGDLALLVEFPGVFLLEEDCALLSPADPVSELLAPSASTITIS